MKMPEAGQVAFRLHKQATYKSYSVDGQSALSATFRLSSCLDVSLLISAPDNQIYFCGVQITSGDPRIFSGSVTGARGL